MAFVQARHFANASRGVGDIHRLVVHTAEIQETRDSAEDVARFFATTSAKVSAHACGDNNTVVECVRDEDIAFHALGDNERTLGFEFSGFAGQSFAQWRDQYSTDMLLLAAKWFAAKATRYSIPLRWLTPEQERARAKGFVTHKVVSDVWGEGIRSDPGANFPFDSFLRMVAANMKPAAETWARLKLLTGEGRELASSGRFGEKPSTQAAKLAAFLSNPTNVKKMLADFDHDRDRGEPEDVRVVRVWES